MRAHTIALLTGVILSVSGFIPESTLAQNAVKPIGKVVTAAGSVTIERVNAVVVQVALGNQPGQAKIGDPILSRGCPLNRSGRSGWHYIYGWHGI